MSTSDWIAICSMVAGLFVTTIGSALFLSFKIGGLNEKVLSMEKTLEKILEILPAIRIEIAEIQVKLDILWKAHVAKSNSPTSLNTTGQDILTKSNIGEFADQRYFEILSKLKSFKPENAYQAQELLISIVGRYKRDNDYQLKLQAIAFSSGYDIDSLLFVAALSIRDRVISDLGFSKELK